MTYAQWLQILNKLPLDTLIRLHQLTRDLEAAVRDEMADRLVDMQQQVEELALLVEG